MSKIPPLAPGGLGAPNILGSQPPSSDFIGGGQRWAGAGVIPQIHFKNKYPSKRTQAVCESLEI